MTRAFVAVGLTAALVLGAWLRLSGLDGASPDYDVPMPRPFHGDEAVHAFRFDELWQTGRMVYNPEEHHGPTLYYATLPIVWCGLADSFADSIEYDYRLVTVAFGIGTILLALLFREGLGAGAAVVAALLMAASVSLVYYSRYYIQETLLAFFVLAAIGCGWRYAWTLQPAWLIASGAMVGLALATKETAVLSILAAALAGVPFLRRRTAWRPVAVGALSSLLVACVLLSDFGRNLRGPWDFVRSFGFWLPRAGGTDLHEHGWRYYLDLIAWTHRSKRAPIVTEALILGPAVIGLLAALGRRDEGEDPHPALLRFLGLYTLALVAIYSLIPYKTPWCVVNLVQPLALLAGVGAVVVLRLVRWRPLQVVGVAGLLAGVYQLSWQAHKLSGDYATHGGNPHCYAHPAPDVMDLGRKVEKIAAASEQGLDLPVQVLSPDSYHWPIPWYLRSLPHVGYLVDEPGALAAPVLVVYAGDGVYDSGNVGYHEFMTQRFGQRYENAGLLGLRPLCFYEIWVQKDVWKRYLDSTMVQP